MSSLEMGADERRLQLSGYVSVFAHMGEIYVYHDLCGYILKMSPDILAFLQDFSEAVDPADVCTKFSDAFGEQPPEAFVGIFLEFGCLVTPGQDEGDAVARMVGVKGPWNVFERHDDGTLTFYAAWGERPLVTHELSADEAAIWDDFDSETCLGDLAKKHGQAEVLAVVERMAHHDFQALKLSKVGLSFYKGRQHMKPPYLTSTMPYAPFESTTDPSLTVFTDLFTDAHLRARASTDAGPQVANREGTLSFLLRQAHPALHGQTYGEALVAGLVRREMLPEGSIRVLQVGGGLGIVAKAVIESLQGRGLTVSYAIVEQSPAMAAIQAEALAGLEVAHHAVPFLTDDWPEGPFDLVLANEVASELRATHLTHTDIGLSDGVIDEQVLDANARLLGEAGRLVTEHGIAITDAPEEFYLNVGAFQLLERMASHLSAGGFGVITEFGELNRYPILTVHAEHPGLSIHWGQMTKLARTLTLEVDYLYTMELLGLDGELSALSTTRSYLKALTGLMKQHGVSLEKVGYTQEMLATLCAGKLDLAKVGELSFERLEERLMGVVPYEHKTLIVGKEGVGRRSTSSLLLPGATETL